VTFLETDIDRDGGKIVLVAGAPQTEGEDEERIIRTARGIADLETPLPLRLGVSRGRVFSGEVGAEFRRTYTILGTTAALAARLMGKAKPGQLLTTSDTLERARSCSRRPRSSRCAKGIAEPARRSAFTPSGSRPGCRPPRSRAPVRRRSGSAPCSGRGGSRRAGFGTLVEAVGEPGTGRGSRTTSWSSAATCCN
jgi:hypothetical protein